MKWGQIIVAFIAGMFLGMPVLSFFKGLMGGAGSKLP